MIDIEDTIQWDGTDKHAKEIGLETKMCMMRFITLYGMYRGHDFMCADKGNRIGRDADGKLLIYRFGWKITTEKITFERGKEDFNE